MFSRRKRTRHYFSRQRKKETNKLPEHIESVVEKWRGRSLISFQKSLWHIATENMDSAGRESESEDIMNFKQQDGEQSEEEEQDRGQDDHASVHILLSIFCGHFEHKLTQTTVYGAKTIVPK